MTCKGCGQLLFRLYGDGERLCASCREKQSEELPAAIKPKPGEEWQPVQGSVGGVGFGAKGGR